MPQAPCRFAVEETSASKALHVECDVDDVNVVSFVHGNRTVYYEHVRAPCVAMPVYGGAVTGKRNRDTMCVDPKQASATAACCKAGGGTNPTLVNKYFFEGVTLATNVARCKAMKMTVCKRTSPVSGDSGKWYYTNRTCGFQVNVDPDGSVKVVHKPTLYKSSRTESVMSWYSVKNTNSFQVQWQGGFPAAAANCGGESACTKRGTSCLCDVTVDTRSVFSAVPTQQQAAASLRIGHADPALFDKGTFTKCTTAACKSASGVDVFLRAQGSIADTSTLAASEAVQFS